MKTLCVLACCFVSVIAFAENAITPDVKPDYGPQDSSAEILISQLGDENFEIRTQATSALKTLGPRAVHALQNASKSFDLEVKSRVRILLPLALESFHTKAAYQIWKDGLPAWYAGLKEGTLVGPVFGTKKIGPAEVPPLDEFVPSAPQAPQRSAVDEGLGWLSLAQEPDGHWDSIRFGAQYNADIEQTSMALLSLLGAGHTEKVGKYKPAVQKAVAWLKAHQRENGAIMPADWTEADGHAHAWAMLALSEAAGMANRPETKAAAQKAVEYAANVHQTRKPAHKEDPHCRWGFGRAARSEPDLFTTALFTLAIKSAKVAGLEIPQGTFDGIIKYLDALKYTSDAPTEYKGKPGLYPWVPGGKPSAKATFMALLCRQFLGWKKEDLAGSAALAMKEWVPCAEPEAGDMITSYFGTLVMFQQGGDMWKEWNQKQKDVYLPLQRSGEGGGSWDPMGAWSGSGRIMSTALTSLCFEVYYIYLAPTK